MRRLVDRLQRRGETVRHQERLWKGSFFAILLINFSVFLSMYLLLTTLPFFVADMGGSQSDAGIVLGIFTLSALLVRFFVGAALDRYGRKRIFMSSSLMFVLIHLAYLTSDSILFLYGLRVIHGMFWGVLITATSTMATDIIPSSRRGEGIGYYGLAPTIGMAVGPALGLFMVRNFPFSALFLAAGVASLLGFILGSLLPETHRPQQGVERKNVLKDLIEPHTIPFASNLFFFVLTYGGIISFMAIYAVEIGLENAGLFFILYAVILLLTRTVVGRLFDARGAQTVLLPGFASTIMALLLIGGFPSLWGLFAGAILFAVGFGSIQPTLLALTIQSAPPQRRGAANATYFASFDVGIAVGSILLGMIADAVGYRMMYLISSVFVLFAFIHYFLILRRYVFSGGSARKEANEASANQ